MSVTVVVGAQWGDEGKGKVVDLLSQNVDLVARYQGGANAGHTVVHDGHKTVLHLLPSGILNPDCVCLLGSGMVIDPVQLMDEIDQVEKAGVNVEGRLFVSHRAHLIMPYHKILDGLNERARGSKNAIGVTGRGIGPAYIDKYNRVGIRIVDLLNRDHLGEKLSYNIGATNRILHDLYGEDALNKDEIVKFYIEFDKRIDPMVKDVSIILNDAVKAGKNIVCEGAQGTLLDIDMGTYPYVTSSNPTAGGAVTGLGIGPTAIDKVVGVIKTYTTRVGMGPFPTEFEPEMEETMRKAGDEYGATTGRARRCGWFDSVIARFAARVNGVQSWALTKLDVLSSFDELKICTGYEFEGKIYDEFPADMRVLVNASPVYETLPGWNTPISHIRKLNELPENAQKYVQRIENLTNTPASIISVGSDRSDTILIDLNR